MGLCARAKTRAFKGAARWRRFHVPSLFSTPISSTSHPKTDVRAAPGKPLISHGLRARMPESQDGLAPVLVIA